MTLLFNKIYIYKKKKLKDEKGKGKAIWKNQKMVEKEKRRIP